MGAYYNEHDPFAAAWLRELIKAGLIADGEVDDRSIDDVRPADLRGFVQCHFFAGIGGWSYALRLAGWDDSRAVWTGSCPCQPFSTAGTQAGGADARDLWPTWFRLIRECRPVVVFGEQVESAITHGWLDRLCDDLEGEGYAVGPAGLPAAGVGAFHIRQRLWFVADALRATGERGAESISRAQAPSGRTGRIDGRSPDGLADGSEAGELGDSNEQRSQRRWLSGHSANQRTAWAPSLVEWIPCTDGKARPVEPGTFPLASGVPARVGRLRGYGNAIVPQCAQAFIEAYLEAVGDMSA